MPCRLVAKEGRLAEPVVALTAHVDCAAIACHIRLKHALTEHQMATSHLHGATVDVARAIRYERGLCDHHIAARALQSAVRIVGERASVNFH